MHISVSDVGQFVGGCIKSLDARFSLNDVRVSSEDFKIPRGLLPLVLWHSRRLSEFALERGIKCDIQPSHDALLNAEVVRVENVSASKHYPIILEGIVQMAETLPRNEIGLVRLDDMVDIFSQEMKLETANHSANRLAK